MAIENFTTFVEVDPNSRITVEASKVTWTDLTRNEDAYVYKDKGDDYFAGGFTINLTITVTAIDSNSGVHLFALANLIDDFQGIVDANGDMIRIGCGDSAGAPYIILGEMDGGANYSGTLYSISLATPYYLKITRDESVGTYGTLYLYTYADAARTTLLNTQSITLHSSKKDYRYIYAFQSINISVATKMSGYTEELEVVYNIISTTAASVTTQAMTSVNKTTATGNGNVTSLGVPAATAYGHVWAIWPDPKTSAYSGITEGVPSATGAFTSSLTDLLQYTYYYCRAYIKNSVGTSYGKTVTFTTLGDVPIVTTYPATDVAVLTALGNGEIDNNGGYPITAYGVYWKTQAQYDIDGLEPLITDNSTDEGATTLIGKFDSLMTELTEATAYRYRAYAINSKGTGYGVVKTFTALVTGVPIVYTRATINVRATTATGVGNLVDIGGSAVTQHGHCWDETEDPTTTDSSSGFWGKTENGTGAVGAFASDIIDLTSGKTYYVRAYAKNTQGTAYGDNDTIYPSEIGESTRGEVSLIGEHLAYTSASATQRALLGVKF